MGIFCALQTTFYSAYDTCVRNLLRRHGMAAERFEMRIDSELLNRLDNWRNSEDDEPSRAEAVRRLLEAGLAHDNRGRGPALSDGEKLIAVMIADLIKKLDIEVETNVD